MVVIFYYPVWPEVKMNQSEHSISGAVPPAEMSYSCSFVKQTIGNLPWSLFAFFITTPSHDSRVMLAEFAQLNSAFVIKTKNKLSRQRAFTDYEQRTDNFEKMA